MNIQTTDFERVTIPSRRYPDGVFHPVSGWVLDAIIALDRARPHFMAEVCNSKPRWRQSLYCAISAGVIEDGALFLERCGADDSATSWGRSLRNLANALLALSPQDIITCAVASARAPNGYCSVIERLGFEPFRDPTAYLRLHALMTDPHRRKQRRTVENLADFNEDHLEAIERLDATLLSPAMVLRARTGAGADNLNAIALLIRKYCSTGSDLALTKAASDLQPTTSNVAWARSWLARADKNLPEPPWHGDEHIRPLLTGVELSDAGKRNRNCLETRVGLLLSGKAAYYEATGDETVIACVIRLENGAWVLSRLVGFANRAVSVERQAELRARFEAVGIQPLAQMTEQADVRRLFSIYRPFDVDEFDLDALEEP